MLTKVVVKKKDGTLIKGLTGNFLTYKNTFHVQPEGKGTGDITEILINDLKAVFFVKSFKGNPSSHDWSKEKGIIEEQYSIGRRLKVIFKDYEVIEGYSHSVHFDRPGFFMIPADPADNNERIYVVFSFLEMLFADGQAVDLTAASRTEIYCKTCGNRIDFGWRYCPYDGTKL